MTMPVISMVSAPKTIFVPSFISVPSIKARSLPFSTISNGGLLIECSSRPQKKATAHHMKTRPRKTQPWDVRRKPTVYPPLPPLPADWTLVSSQGENDGGQVPEVGLEAPASTG